MKTNNKTHLQCGYEDECKHKNCLKCRKNYQQMTNMKLNLAEQIAIEDFAVCDLKAMLEEKPEEMELMQDIMRKVMRKVFKEEKE